MRVADVVWEADDFSFKTVLNLPVGIGRAMGGAAGGAVRGELTVNGSLIKDGSIQGSFIRHEEPGADLGIKPFEGARMTGGR